MDSKRFVSAHEVETLSLQLAKKIEDSGFHPTLLLGIWRGGCIPALYVHEYLEWKGQKVQHAPLKVQSYTGIGQQETVQIEDLSRLYAKLSPRDRILVIDDVFDTGRTIVALKTALRKYEMKAGVLFYKPQKNQTQMIPDFFVEETDAWIVFPHELQGLSEDELRQRNVSLSRQ